MSDPADETGFLEALGQRVRTMRGLRGMSRKVLAKVSGISERYIAQLESGKGNVSIVLLRRVSNAMGAPLEDLIPGAPAGCYRGPDGLRALIGGARAPFTTLRFQIVLGPIIADDLLAARWRADGIYGGGISAAKVPAGTAISFGGHDFLRFRDDRFIEFWGGADDSHLMSQLGLFQGG